MPGARHSRISAFQPGRRLAKYQILLFSISFKGFKKKIQDDLLRASPGNPLSLAVLWVDPDPVGSASFCRIRICIHFKPSVKLDYIIFSSNLVS